MNYSLLSMATSSLIAYQGSVPKIIFNQNDQNSFRT